MTIITDHSEPYGLGRADYRYAEEDHLERTAAYRAVVQHGETARAWMTAESNRLWPAPKDLRPAVSR